MISVDDIILAVKEYNPLAPLDQVKDCIEFTAAAHQGQKRKSGDPYLVHPLEVAKILTQLKMDHASILAAILHDTIEDTSVTKDDILKRFGKDVAEIVDGVTKISKIKFETQQDRQAENYRKMILAMSKDIRVIMVKLADRLNNMRTLQFMSEAKQVNIAQETLDIYAPIAGRMGIYWIKEELETLAFKFLKPQVYKQIVGRHTYLQKKREQYVDRVRQAITDHLSSTIKGYEISGRIKKPYSTYRKMQRQQIGIEDINDLFAFRVIVASIEQCYEVLGTIHALWKPVQGRFKDYVAMPKANNYQSLHTTVVCFDGERVEFQIRTKEMHEIAEKGIAAHWSYKEDGQLDTKDEEKFRWLRQLVDWQKELTDSIEFVDTMKLDLFEDEIFVFTPKGDLKNLPQNATPVDFAYAVHSDVGNCCAGARVNGRIVPLSHRLESGDSVDIITNKNHVPSKDWLETVITSKAKSHIRQFIRKEQRQKSILIGRNLFETACQKRKLSHKLLLKQQVFVDFLQEKAIVDEEEFYVALAYGKLNIKDVLEKLIPKKEEEQKNLEESQGVIRRIFDKIGTKNKNLIFVDQQDGIMVTFGKCCSPVKGDPIVGFVTRGRGVVVHRTDCDRVLSIDPDRRVKVDWNDKTDQPSLARILIISEDRQGILADITKTISERNVNINKVLVKTQKDGIARISFDLSVTDVHELRRVINALENSRYILNVIRQ